MFNVVIVNDAAHVTGGAGQVALASAINLSKRGIHVVVFAAVGPIGPELVRAGVEVVLVGQKEILRDKNRLRAATQGLWNRQALMLLKQTLGNLRPEETIVHFHAWVKALSSSVVRVTLGKGFPVICTLHDYFTSCPNGGFFNYKRNEICSLRPLSTSCVLENCDTRNYTHKLWRITRHWMQRRWGMMPDFVTNYIYNSTLSREIASPHLPADSQYFKIPPFIDIDQKPAVNSARNNIYAMVGRLTKEKGCLLFAEAARRAGVRCLFIGDGDIRSEILQINSNAEITGWLPHAEVVKKLKFVRALVYPTLWYETFGMAVLEAASVGIPSLVGRGRAAAELVEDDVTGYLFKSGDPEDLRKKILRLQSDRLVGNLGSMAYKRYWTNPFTVDRHISSLLNAYQAIMRKPVESEILQDAVC